MYDCRSIWSQKSVFTLKIYFCINYVNCKEKLKKKKVSRNWFFFSSNEFSLFFLLILALMIFIAFLSLSSTEAKKLTDWMTDFISRGHHGRNDLVATCNQPTTQWSSFISPSSSKKRFYFTRAKRARKLTKENLNESWRNKELKPCRETKQNWSRSFFLVQFGRKIHLEIAHCCPAGISKILSSETLINNIFNFNFLFRSFTWFQWTSKFNYHCLYS